LYRNLDTPKNGVIDPTEYLINGHENSIFGFELVGLRHINQLTEFQAREICPYQVGEDHFNAAVNRIFSAPVMICILRRLNAIPLLNQLWCLKILSQDFD